MASRQIEVCAARLPEPRRAEFLAAMARATKLQKEAGAIARAAWAAYRKTLGLPPRKPKQHEMIAKKRDA